MQILRQFFIESYFRLFFNDLGERAVLAEALINLKCKSHRHFSAFSSRNMT